MTQADLQYDPARAFHRATAQKSHKAVDISFNATTPLADLFDHANYKNPGKKLSLSKFYNKPNDLLLDKSKSFFLEPTRLFTEKYLIGVDEIFLYIYIW